MAALPLVALDPAPGPRPVVIVGLPHVVDGGHLGAVVATEQDHRVFPETQLIDFFDQCPHDEIHLENEITMRPGICCTLERPTGEGW